MLTPNSMNHPATWTHVLTGRIFEMRRRSFRVLGTSELNSIAPCFGARV